MAQQGSVPPAPPATASPPGQGSIKQRIADIARYHGVDPGYLLSTARTESNFDPSARARSSSAAGLFQFTDATWRAVANSPEGRSIGLDSADRMDPDANTHAAAILTRKNQAALEAETGLPATPAMLYLAHQQGIGGASALLRASGTDATGEDIVGSTAAKNNPSFFYGDGGRPLSADDVIARAEQRFG